MFESLSDVSLRRLGKFAIDVTTKVPSPTNGDKEEASPTWDPRGADPTGEWHKSNHMADLGQVLPNYNKTKPYLRRFTYIRNNVTISASSSPTAEPTTTKDVQAGTEPGPTSSVSRRVRDIHITEVPLEDPLEIIAAGAVRLAKLQELGAVNDDGTISRRPSRPRSTHARTGSNSSTSSFGSWWSSERASSRKTMQKDSFRRISTAAKAANAFAYPARTVSLKDVEIEASVTESQGSTFSKWSGGVMERLSSWVENDWGAHAKAVSEQATLLWQTMSMDIVDFAGEGVDDEGSVIPGPGFDERGGDSGIK
ncbi:hypothetical protein BJ742DRAFT_251982 [Cladochytrium replicatum]|nr:hypothetical protein BJ742DRAFT_251982 [Cladochytrium replicatum]